MNGIIVVDKPKGFTSFDVVAKLRGILREKRIGHGGTLDPMATGVLPVFVGEATKAVDLLPSNKKSYLARVKIGLKTDTGDITGNIVKRSDKRFELKQLEDYVPRFIGKQEQIPPMYSAVKIDGKKLYELAREGKTVERKPRPIEIFSLSVFDYSEENAEISLSVDCSKGTYIRTLAEDIFESAGYLGTLVALRRSFSAGFSLDGAHTLDEIQAAAQNGTAEELLLPVETAFLEYRERVLDENLSRLFLNGFRFETTRIIDVAPSETVRIKNTKGDFLGLGRDEDGRFVKLKQFFAV